jgi:purine-binding chemotaxis protein CheW
MMKKKQFDKDLEHIESLRVHSPRLAVSPSFRRKPESRKLDWMPDQVRHDERCLAASCGVVQAVIEKPLEDALEKKKAILRSRAKKLAQEIEGDGTDEECFEILEFLLAQETYAVETSFIREVYPLTELTPLPCTPSFIFGLINVRGQILTVMDMKKFFDLPERGITNLNKVIVVKKDAMELGILADEIIGIKSISGSDIKPLPATITGIGAEYLRGVMAEGLIVLDMESFLTDKKLIVQEEVDA